MKNRMPTVRVLVILAAVGLGAGRPGAARGQAPAATEVARQFVEKQYAVGPVAGEFVVTGHSLPDPARQADRAAAGWKDAPADRILKCRWAFDRDREVMDTLPGSSGVFRRFYIGPAGLIDGSSEKSYNLDKVRTVAVTRPGSFFFLNGRNDRWATDLTDPAAKLTVALRDAVTLLTVERGNLTYELTLDAGTLLLRSARGLVGGVELYTMQVHSFARDPGSAKAFPNDATLRVKHPKSGLVVKEERLKAVSVEFPKDRAGGAAFSLMIPAGAAVGDRLLNRAIVIEKATDAASLLSNPSQSKTQPYAQDVPAVVAEGDPEPPYTPDRWLTWYWVGALSVLAASTAFVAVRYVVSKRTAGP